MKNYLKQEWEISSNYSQQEASEILKSKVTIRKPFEIAFRKPKTPYQGEIQNNRFKVSRVIHYRNSFLPNITGEITSKGKGSKIKISFGLHIFVQIFLIVFVLFSFIPFFTFRYAEVDNFSLLFFPFFFILFFTIIYLTYNYECKRAVKDFTAFFNAYSVTKVENG